MLTSRSTAAMLAVLVMTAAVATAQSGGSPELVVPSKIIDAGTVSQGVVVDAVLVVDDGEGADQARAEQRRQRREEDAVGERVVAAVPAPVPDPEAAALALGYVSEEEFDEIVRPERMV